MTRIADLAGSYLRRQVLAGASAVQVFDSWAGTLSRPDYEKSVRPFTQRVLTHIADLPVPRIHFGVVTGELLGAMALPECDVVGWTSGCSLPTVTRIDPITASRATSTPRPSSRAGRSYKNEPSR